jgi:VanZ family protein
MWSAKYSRSLAFAGAALLAAIVVATFVPAAWQVRLGLHWLLEHFLAYFALTLVFSLSTRRPMAVAAALLPLAILLESLQALTGDRVADAATALFAAAGVALAALFADLAMVLRGEAANGPKA